MRLARDTVAERCDPVRPLAPPPVIQTELERRRPGRASFANGGRLAVLRTGEVAG